MRVPIYLVIFAVLVIAAGYLLFFKNTPESKLFEDAASPVMYFYQDTCSHCIAMIPVQNRLAAEGYRVKPMNAGADPSLWKTYSVSGTPTWIAPSGERLVGEQSQATLRDFLERNGARIADPTPSTA